MKYDIHRVRWPSVPHFPGQSRFLTTCPGKITVLAGCPFVPFLDLCPGFVPICSSLLTHRWLKISSDFIRYIRKHRLRPGLCPRLRWGSSRRSLRPQVGPPTARACGARAIRWYDDTIRAFDARPGLRCPNYVYRIYTSSVQNLIQAWYSAVL